MFQRILIANRGEIACRVIRTAHRMGLQTVAVYSDADADAPHVQLADRAVHIGPSVAAQSYLSIERILEAAKRSGAQAIHPGYGFLAENAAFATACEKAGLIFIGPPAEAIHLMGNKRLAKKRMIEAGVPCVPGYQGEAQSLEALTTEAQKLGAPLMIKASAGGGGRGLRLVTDLSQLSDQLHAARSEAESSFGDGELILERAVLSPRHIEIQVFADQAGQVVHLGERDCSVQRRHQKVIEEAPGVSPSLRAKMGEAAVKAAAAIGYVGAGTCEFLLSEKGEFYFMEMNTRLQVEHPVTEMIYGVDLVAWQLDVAAGRPLPMSQEALSPQGHAMEVRLYAEDPYAGFLPQTGKLHRLSIPEEPGAVRADCGVQAGQDITAFYDPMIAKIITHGRDREEARLRLRRALSRTVVHGPRTNLEFLRAMIDHPAFIKGAVSTGFIAEHFEVAERPAPDAAELALAAVLFMKENGEDFWRSNPFGPVPIKLLHNEEERSFMIEPLNGPGANANQRFSVREQGEAQIIELLEGDGLCFVSEGMIRSAVASIRGAELFLSCEGRNFSFERLPHSKASEGGVSEGAVVAPMSGRVIEVRAEVGANAKKGQILVILEAMKMQMELLAPKDGKIAMVSVQPEQQVDAKSKLVEIE